MKRNILAFGDVMLKLMDNHDSKESLFGGSEFNVLVSLASLGNDVSLLSSFGNDKNSSKFIELAIKLKVNIINYQNKDKEIGKYSIIPGEGVIPSKVNYDRLDSAFNNTVIPVDTLEKILINYDLFHFSGINLCLSDASRNVLFNCLKICKKNNIKISFDFNYRSSLKPINDVKKYYQLALDYADIVLASRWDFMWFLDDPDIEYKLAYPKDYLLEEYNLSYLVFKNTKVISNELRSISAEIYSKNDIYKSKEIQYIVKYRVGGGDAFDAGVLNGILNNHSLKDSILLGIKNSILVQSTIQDYATFDEKYLNDFELSYEDIRR